MEIRFICTYWGQNHLSAREFVRMAMEAGYDGVEVNIPDDPAFVEDLQEAVRAHGAVLIAQQHLPAEKETPEAYMERMSDRLQSLAGIGPVLINSQTGKDHFSFEENCRMIDRCMQISRETGIPIFHETHRGRFSFHAATLLPYLDKYPSLGLCADLSHFCAVSESLLEDQEEILERIFPSCRYVHARIGFGQGAQVNHPFAPEWKDTLLRFLSWWQKIILVARERGEDVFYVCPEAGPPPYMPTLPFSNAPVADQWEINLKMLRYLKKELK